MRAVVALTSNVLADSIVGQGFHKPRAGSANLSFGTRV